MTTLAEKVVAAIGEDYCPLSTDPMGLNPRQIIYRELLVNVANPDASTYRNHYVPKQYRESTFPNLLRIIANYGYDSENYDNPEDSVLDIPVYKRTMIIIQLPRSSNLSFGEPAIVMKCTGGTSPDELYGELRYVDDQGVASPDHFINCKLIHFCAHFVPGQDDDHPYRQSFNYYVNGAPQPFRAIPIDPDIRHPGNGGDEYEP